MPDLPKKTEKATKAHIATMTEAERLIAIAEILDAVDNRCLAVDGPVSPTRHEITDRELRTIYLNALGEN